ncbi:MAG: DUF2252 family protein [Myxococcales bacterium]|nr:DUF2252 family protein [Myxococcales bacterium]
MALSASATVSCDPALDARDAWLVSTIVRAELPWMRARPTLVARKFERMAASVFDFYRGTYPAYARDALEGTPSAARTEFAPGALVPGIGDAHPENVGVLLGADDALGLEFNDFDAADRVPYYWDLRRLAAGIVVATRVSNAGDDGARATLIAAAPAATRTAIASYLDALRAHANGATPERRTSGQGAPPLEDLFRRGNRDRVARAELAGLTVVRDGQRRFIRGAPDPEAPTETLEELPAVAREALPSLFERYRLRLAVSREPAFFSVLDAVRQFGSGVASMPRIRALVLVRGPTDALEDDVILEVKELGDSGAPGTLLPGVWADSVASRVRNNAYTAWGSAEREPLWSSDEWLGLPVQIRAEREAHKTLRAVRLTGANGTPAALDATARVLGALLARVHCSTPEGLATASAIVRAVDARSDEAFVSEHSDAAVSYAALVERDWSAFRVALRERGPLLGFVNDPEDAPSTDARALFLAEGGR